MSLKVSSESGGGRKARSVCQLVIASVPTMGRFSFVILSAKRLSSYLIVRKSGSC